jgi:1-acyl-sn-glycerol-3-phosphate acyltransferase
MAERSYYKLLGYALIRVVSRWIAVIGMRMRCEGRHHIPPHGAMLVCSNHQSLNYLARKTLFHWTFFRWLIEYLDAIPIDREGAGLEGLKESLRRLRRGESLLVFPEGTRSPDGQVGPLQPGICLLARRSQALVIPMALDGAFEAWPRSALGPKLARIHACIGTPLTPAEIAQWDDSQLLSELESRIRDCFLRASTSRQRLSGRSRSDGLR